MLNFPSEDSYNLLDVKYFDSDTAEFVNADLAVCCGRITNITRKYSGNGSNDMHPTNNDAFMNLSDYILLPTFVDVHTHLDKTHTDLRAANEDQSHCGAVRATLLDRVHFTVTDLYRRMDFALSCAFHHGTAMIRTHINSSSDLNVTEMAWKVFNDMKVKWHDKIFLQGVIFILPSFEFGTTGKAEEIAAVGIKYGGSILGASFSTPTSEFSSDSEKDGTYTTAQFTDELSGLFALAKKFELYIDVHVDEHANEKSENLLMLARETIAQNYQGKVTASHCCSLSLASPELLQSTIQSILEAGIAVVSLPTCNLYLQDRAAAKTPRWRGCAPVQELRAAGISVSFASDNVRDAFFPYGDMDMMEVFGHSCRITHVGPREAPHWLTAITSTPASLIARGEKNDELSAYGPSIKIGAKANFVVFQARSLHEVICRPNTPRWVIREGKAATSTLPSYRALDDINTPSFYRNNPSTPVDETIPEIRLESTLQRRKMETIQALIPVIDIQPLLNSRSSQEELDRVRQEIWSAATEVGFFQISNHGISTQEIAEAFDHSRRFFELPLETKRKFSLKRELNSGFEYFQQVRPSTNQPDQKESFQITNCNMEKGCLWPPEEELPTFRPAMETFAQRTHSIALLLLSSLAVSLGYPKNYFDSLHDATAEDCQATLRLLHYPAVDATVVEDKEYFRAGPHTDWDCLTLLYQREGENGLEVASHDASSWTPVQPIDSLITVNIGDMLMRWSDDKLKSTLHRVQFPSKSNDVSFKERYSIAYFMQANKGATIQGLEGKYSPITAGDYILMRIKSNYAK